MDNRGRRLGAGECPLLAESGHSQSSRKKANKNPAEAGCV